MSRNWGKFVGIAAGVFLGAFGALWTFLEPVGGFGAIDDAVSRDAMNYFTLCLISLVIGIIVALVRTGGSGVAGGRLGVIGDSRLEADFLKLLAGARKKVTIVGISLPTFTSEKGLRVIGGVVKEGVRVDLLFVNPLSPAILQRPKNLYGSYQLPSVTAAASVRSCLRFKEKLGDEEVDRFRVHLVNVLPSCAAVIIDGVCCWHPYLAGYTGVNSPYIHGSTSDGFGAHIAAHVDSLIESYSFEPKAADVDALQEGVGADSLLRTELTEAELESIRNSLSS